MSNFNKFCLLFIVGMVYANTATAVDVSALTKYWGGGTLLTCGTTNISVCIPSNKKSDVYNSPESCKVTLDDDKKWTGGFEVRSNAKDERAILMMVARKIQGNCAYFCPTQIEAKNTNKKAPWTEYANAGQASDCVWLCQDGDWSETSFKTDVCDITTFSLPTKTSGATEGPDIGKTIPFFKTEHRLCGSNIKEEHNMFLAIVGNVDSEHGAQVQQVVVRANHSGYKDMYSWPEVYPAGDAKQILACKIGYKPNELGTDCVKVSEPACAKQQMASGFDGEKFDANEHTLQLNEDSKYEFRCKESDEGFKRGTYECVKCINNPIHDGINPTNFECVHCEDGKAFNPGAANSSYCSDMIQVDKTVLQYGNHKDKKFTDQCWTKDSSDYADCVKPAPSKQ